MTPTPSEQAAAVLNLIDKGVLGWDEPEVMRVLKAASKGVRTAKIVSKETRHRSSLQNKRHQPG